VKEPTTCNKVWTAAVGGSYQPSTGLFSYNINIYINVETLKISVKDFKRFYWKCAHR